MFGINYDKLKYFNTVLEKQSFKNTFKMLGIFFNNYNKYAILIMASGIFFTLKLWKHDFEIFNAFEHFTNVLKSSNKFL